MAKFVKPRSDCRKFEPDARDEPLADRNVDEGSQSEVEEPLDYHEPPALGDEDADCPIGFQ